MKKGVKNGKDKEGKRAGFWDRNIIRYGWSRDDVERVRAGDGIKVIGDRFGFSERKREEANKKTQGKALKGKQKKVYRLLRKMGYSHDEALNDLEEGMKLLRGKK